MSDDVIGVLLKLKGLREYVSGMKQAGGATRTAGDQAEQAGKKGRRGAAGLAKFAGGAVGVYAAGRYLKKSAGATEDLAKSSLGLMRTTGLDFNASSKWVKMAELRGVKSKQLGASVVKLDKAMEGARTGNKKQAAMFKDLGVSQDLIAKGDSGSVMLQLADAFAKMKSPAEKAATAQALFGKAGGQLLPILAGGSKGIAEQFALFDKYGLSLKNTSEKGAVDLIKRQREMKIANEGLSIQLGQNLLPIMTALSGVLVTVFAKLQPLLRNSTVLKVVLGLLTVAFLAYKGAVVYTTIAQMGLNAAFLANPIVLAVAAIVALGIAFVVAYKKIGWFHNAVDAVFGWIKTHWPLLLAILTGPLGLAVLAIVKHWSSIRNAATSAVRWVGGRITALVGFFRGVPGKISAAARGAFDGLKDAFKGAYNFIARAWNSLRLTFTVPIIHKHITVGTPHMPLLARGGFASGGGAAVVGDAGPEILDLPRGARVTPLTRAANVPAMAGAGAGVGSGATFISKVYLDRRQIAEAVGEHIANERARG